MELGLVGLWLATLLVLGALALPVAAALLPHSDHGPFAFAVGLAILAVVGHLAGQLAYGWPAVAAGLTALAGAALVAAPRADWDGHSFAEGAVVFVLGFLLVVGLRAVDPAAAPLPVAVGEKFLDFGLLATLSRSATLPPTDVWFAGRPVRYYYGGHLTTSLLATLTDTPPRFAYNLGLATFYATLVTTAYGLAGSIVADHGGPRRLAAGLGAFLVGLAANLETALRVVGWMLPTGIARGIAGAFGLDPSTAAWTPADFDYWDASRVIPVDPTAADPFYAATEFPLFAWLNGDLHAHMLSQPFMLLAAGLLLGYWRAADDRAHRRLLLFGALGPLAGLIGFVNLWSFPTVGGLTALTVAFAPGDPAAVLPARLGERLPPRPDWPTEELRRLAIAGPVATVVLALGVAWTLPYWLGGLPGSSNAGLAIWEAPTALGPLLVVHGAFLAAIVPYLATRTVPALSRPLLLGGVLGLAVATILLGFPALGLFGPLLVASWWLLRTRRDVGFETVLLLGGLGLVLIVEVVTVEGERFNTIFKPYVHVWLLWAIATAAILARSMGSGTASAEGADRSGDRSRARRAWAALGLAIVLTTGLYAGFALPAHVEAGSRTADATGPTLDATAFVELYFPAEAGAIRWLGDRTGQPTIVTAAPGGYWWRPADGDGASAPATLTGLPTVLGWYHEAQYRGSEPYERRLGHVETIYEGEPARQAAMLERYDVRYVYVGPAERASYDVTIDAHPALEQVYPTAGEGEAVVYRVDRDQL